MISARLIESACRAWRLHTIRSFAVRINRQIFFSLSLSLADEIVKGD